MIWGYHYFRKHPYSNSWKWHWHLFFFAIANVLSVVCSTCVEFSWKFGNPASMKTKQTIGKFHTGQIPSCLRMQVVAGRIKSLEYLGFGSHGSCRVLFLKRKLMRVFAPKVKNGGVFLLFFPGKKDDMSQKWCCFFLNE